MKKSANENIKVLDFSDKNCVFMLSDIHFGLKSGGANTIKYVEWMENINGYFNKFFIPLVKKYKTQLYNPILIVGGDFFDTRLNLRVDVMNSAIQLVKKISAELPIVFIVGNHDSYYEDNTETNSLVVFEGIDNVIVTKELTRVKVAGSTFDLVSWLSNSKEQSDIIKNSNADYMILHADINGLMYPSKVKIADKVETKGFKGTRIYSGHIHKRQEKGKVTYLGSPYEIDWSDSGNVKGVYILTFNKISNANGNVEWDIDEKFEENTYSPRFVSYDIEDINKIVSDGGNISETFGSNYISVNYKSEDAPKYRDLMNSLSETNVRGLSFSEIREEVKIDEEKVGELKSLSVDDAVMECINGMELSDEEKEFLRKKHEEYIKTLG